jgi:hypothetical protein
MSISRFDDLEGRIYHEVLLDHQRDDDNGNCLCGWKVYVNGIYTHRMHLAIVLKDWMEANFILIDKV